MYSCQHFIAPKTETIRIVTEKDKYQQPTKQLIITVKLSSQKHLDKDFVPEVIRLIGTYIFSYTGENLVTCQVLDDIKGPGFEI